jgi:hypothetical protein
MIANCAEITISASASKMPSDTEGIGLLSGLQT